MSFVTAALVAELNSNCVLMLLAGTPVGDQLLAVFQFPLAAPVHVWAETGWASTARTAAARATRLPDISMVSRRVGGVFGTHRFNGGLRRPRPPPTRTFPNAAGYETGFFKKMGRLPKKLRQSSLESRLPR